jgi:hypothetical protein
VQTYPGKAFEIDLDEDWRFYPEEAGLLYFQNQRIDVGLACDSMVWARHDRDTDEFAPRFFMTYVEGIAEATAIEDVASGGVVEPPKLLSVDQLPVQTGHEWLVAGQTSSRGRWMAWVMVRKYMYFTMRMESLTLPAAQLANLFEQARRSVYLAELVPGAWD